jgi:hypothetical protein
VEIIDDEIIPRTEENDYPNHQETTQGLIIPLSGKRTTIKTINKPFKVQLSHYDI